MTLSDLWRSRGVEPGDVLLVHASSRRTLQTHGITPADLLQSFIEAVGENGCLVVPTFNFGWCRDEPLDQNLYRSEMGILSETARCDHRFTSTAHRVYSFAWYGSPAEDFHGLNDVDAFGPNTMFDRLIGNDAKIGVLDLPDQNSLTMLHHIEQTVGVSYRFHKNFDRFGSFPFQAPDDMKCRIFVRGNGIETDVSGMENLLWQRGLYRGDRPRVASGFRTIKARALFDATAAVIREGRAEGMLYKRATAKNEPGYLPQDMLNAS